MASPRLKHDCVVCGLNVHGFFLQTLQQQLLPLAVLVHVQTFMGNFTPSDDGMNVQNLAVARGLITPILMAT